MADFYAGRSFLSPAFELHLNGTVLGKSAMADVVDLTFTDDLQSVPSFEFTLDDWDPDRLLPKYSSPWNPMGQPYTAPDGSALPVIEPGVRVNLYFGYRDDGPLPLVMQGEVVSVQTSFPAAGRPVAKIRALDYFQRSLQRVWVETNLSGTDKSIVDQICSKFVDPSLKVVWSPLDSEGEPRKNQQIDGPAFDEIAKRAQAYGLSVFTGLSKDGSAYTLNLVRPGRETDTGPAASFTWGRTLLSFTPVISAAAAIEKVVVRGADPAGKDKARRIEVTRTWSDIGLDESLLGSAEGGGFPTIMKGLREVIKPDRIRTTEDATAAADAHLRKLASTLITGSGQSIGLPELRAGRTIELMGLGTRFTGVYRLTKTTHTFGASGYLTSFEARKEVLS